MPSKELFVSYSSSDIAFTEDLVTEIEARGIGCWYAKRDIRPGGVYPVEITRALDDCRALLLVFSADTNRAANENLHILREIDYAASSRKPILPVRIADVEPHEGLAYFLRTVQWIERSAGDPRLADRIAEVYRSAVGGTTEGSAVRSPVPPLHDRSFTRRLGWSMTAAACGLLIAGAAFERDRLSAALEAFRSPASNTIAPTSPVLPAKEPTPPPTEAPTSPAAPVRAVPPGSATAADKPRAPQPDTPAEPAAGAPSIRPTAPPPPEAPPSPAAILERARSAFSARDYAATAALLQPLAQAGNAVASFRLADLLENGSGIGRDQARAMALYQRAAEAGVACAKNRVGELHESGALGAPDLAEALRWWRAGARAGCPWSKLRLGVAYKDGHGVARDGAEAVRFLDQAAQDGLVDAMSYLGAIYRRGDLVPADPGAMVRYQKQAAALGHENAQYRLAVAYNTGQGIAKNAEEAYVWAVVSATKGEPEPKRLRDTLARGFAPFQRADLEATARVRADQILRVEAANYLRLDDWLWKADR